MAADAGKHNKAADEDRHKADLSSKAALAEEDNKAADEDNKVVVRAAGGAAIRLRLTPVSQLKSPNSTPTETTSSANPKFRSTCTTLLRSQTPTKVVGWTRRNFSFWLANFAEIDSARMAKLWK